jgi:hypothetical protein
MAKVQGPFPVSTEDDDGNKVEGTYTVEGSGGTATVRVMYQGQTDSTHAGGSGAEVTAQRLLRRLAFPPDFRRPAKGGSV